MSATKYYLVQLPCKTYIRKYIAATYGSPVKATIKHSLGAMINASLDKNIYLERTLSDSFIHKYYTDKLPIAVTKWQFDRIGFDFPDDKVHLINRFMEDLFEQHLFQWVDAGVQVGRERKGCIEQFASLYHIETEIDIGFDALKKIEYRKRKELGSAIDIPLNTLKTMEYRTRKPVEELRNGKALQFSLFT